MTVRRRRSTPSARQAAMHALFGVDPCEKEAARQFAAAAQAGELETFCTALAEVDRIGAWRAAFMAAARIEAPASFRTAFLELYADSSATMRSLVGDDANYVRGLRALLPRYDGPGLKLYRGETAFARRHRSYGTSWTADIVVARSHAALRVRDGMPSVLLETDAPAEAIISAPHLLTTSFHESEFVIDRRLLGLVRVIERA